MNKLSKIWTASIAYVALIVGAGSSVTFNILDMRQVRGGVFDRWDLFIAVLAPAMVVLMVEMFVSRLWTLLPDLAGQFIRWTVTVAIGAVAMRVSWTHGHAFLLTRGQTPDVATMWPLAIDGLAIMATALIVAGRRGHVATGQLRALANQEMANEDLATWPDGQEPAIMAGHGGDELATAPGLAIPGRGRIDVPPMGEVEWADANQLLDRLAGEYGAELSSVSFSGTFDTSATQPMDPAWDIAAAAEAIANTPKPPVISGSVRRVPDEVRELIVLMDQQRASKAEIDQAVMQMHVCSHSTARKFRTTVLKGGES